MKVVCLKAVSDGTVTNMPGTVIDMDSAEAERLVGWVESAALAKKKEADSAPEKVPAISSQSHGPDISIGLDVPVEKLGKR